MKALSVLFLCVAAAATGATIDNDHVRVLAAVDQPHHKGELHQHDVNRVMIYLDAGDLDVVYEDGRVDHQHWKANDIAWSPAGARHTSENVGNAVLRIVEIELKQPGPAAAPQRSPKLDPLVIDPSHNKLIFENNQVRVFRSTRESASEEMWHEHVGAGRVAVLLTDLDGQVTSGDGNVSEMPGKRGDLFWSEGTFKHRAKNILHKGSELVIVEVK